MSAKTWYDDRQRVLWAAAAGAVVLVGAMFALDSYLEKGRRASGELLRTAVATANAPIVAAETELPEDEAPDESYPTRTARAQKARERFQHAVSGHLSALPEAWARLGEANALQELGKPGEALKLYEQVTKTGDLPAFIRWRALEGAGYALEAEQKYADAATRFEEIGKLADGAFKPAGDYHLARMQIAQSAPQKAADLLQALVKAERARPPGEGTRFQSVISDAETLLTELSVQLNAPNLRPEPAAPTAAPAPPVRSSEAASEISPEVIEQLRKQLAEKGGKAVPQEVIDALTKQAKQGQAQPNSPAKPAPAGTKPASSAPPAEAPKDNAQ